MSTLQTAVSAVTGITWHTTRPEPGLIRVGSAWDDAGRLVVVSIVRPVYTGSSIHGWTAPTPPSSAAITTALRAVPLYSQSPAVVDQYGALDVTTWTPSAVIDGGSA